MLDIDLPELGVVSPARPCSQKWSSMEGDGPVRVCSACQCKVFDIGQRSSEEVRQLIRQHSEGDRIEARLFQRFDRTLLLQDCPRGRSHGWSHLEKLVPSTRTVMLMLFLALSGAGVTITLLGDNIRRLFARSSNCSYGPYEPGPARAQARSNLRLHHLDNNPY